MKMATNLIILFTKLISNYYQWHHGGYLSQPARWDLWWAYNGISDELLRDGAEKTIGYWGWRECQKSHPIPQSSSGPGTCSSVILIYYKTH